MLFLRRIPRIVAALQLLPTLRQPVLVDGPRLSIRTATAVSSSIQTSTIHSSSPAMSSSAAAESAGTPEVSCAAEPTTSTPSKPEPTPEPKLPPLTPAEFRAYNRMAEHMDQFHNHFRSVWNMIWNACNANKRPANMSLKSFLNEGLQFIRHLTAHHNIEEAYFFPVLARKMPEFKAGKGNGAAELLRQHREIHKGMDVFEEYLKACKSGETELQLSVLKTKMESWGTVLWTHLDQEVKTLGAENMRKYWTLDEMKNMPM